MDKMSANNFSTTTKSKFNTIDQYNQGNNGNGGSNSRHGSPVRLTNQFSGYHNYNVAGDTQGHFNLRNCTIYSN